MRLVFPPVPDGAALLILLLAAVWGKPDTGRQGHKPHSICWDRLTAWPKTSPSPNTSVPWPTHSLGMWHGAQCSQDFRRDLHIAAKRKGWGDHPPERCCRGRVASGRWGSDARSSLTPQTALSSSATNTGRRRNTEGGNKEPCFQVGNLSWLRVDVCSLTSGVFESGCDVWLKDPF